MQGRLHFRQCSQTAAAHSPSSLDIALLPSSPGDCSSTRAHIYPEAARSLAISMNHLPLEQQHTAGSWQLPVDAQQFQHADRFSAQQQPYYHHPPQQALPEGVFEREHLFEKPLTPSDVGKLNRLVIPKQHAERYFPLGGESGEKGLLLSFEDEAGKAWRFRYSYWTSSQSYVLTKGWSRFVKEKRLDAGDVVLFEKRRSTGDRLYIGWKRRGAPHDRGSSQTAEAGAAQLHPAAACHSAAAAAAPQHHHHHPHSCPNGVNLHDSSGEQYELGQLPYAARSPSAVTVTNSKRLRLFGVNLECGPEPEPEPLRPGSGSDAVGSSPCMEMGDCGRRSLHLPYMHAGGAFYQS